MKSPATARDIAFDRLANGANAVPVAISLPFTDNGVYMSFRFEASSTYQFFALEENDNKTDVISAMVILVKFLIKIN
jgi:hypothetical protein